LIKTFLPLALFKADSDRSDSQSKIASPRGYAINFLLVIYCLLFLDLMTQDQSKIS